MPFLLVALVITAVVIYLAWRGVSNTTSAQSGALPKPKPRTPIAPDDDPDFLGEINRRLRGEDKSS